MESEKKGRLELLRTSVATATSAFQQSLPQLWPQGFPDFGEHYAEALARVSNAAYKRRQMPVINDDDYVKMKSFLVKSVKVKVVKRNPLHLYPLQSQIYLSKLIEHHKAKGIEEVTDPILLSGDDHVIDGHHRWLDTILIDQEVPTFQIGLPVDAVFYMAIGMSDVERHLRNK